MLVSTPTHLYRWFDVDGVLLYVGISVSPSERAHAHLAGSRWTRWAVRMDVGAEYPTRLDALAAEGEAIRRESPVFNIAGADDPWGRINRYLASKGEEPIRPPGPPDRTGKAKRANYRWPVTVAAVSDLGGEFMQRLAVTEELLAELLEDIETTPDPLVAAEMSGVAAKLVYETADRVSALRARIVCDMYEAGGLSYGDLSRMLGVTRMRAHQIVAAGKRQHSAA